MISLEQAKALAAELHSHVYGQQPHYIEIIQKHMDAFARETLDDNKRLGNDVWRLEKELAKLKELLNQFKDDNAKHREANRELLKDKELLDKLLRPINWLGIVEVNSVRGSAVWYLSRDAIKEFYADREALDKAALAKERTE